MPAGTMRYYIQAYNKDMDPVGNNGEAKTPYQVPVREEIYGPPPHLPNKNPPKSCHGKSKGAGAASKGGRDIEPVAAEAPETAPEETGKREPKQTSKQTIQPLRRWWIGVGSHFDFLQMPQGKDLCLLNPTTAMPVNSLHVFCYAPATSSDFPAHSPAGQVQNGELRAGSAGSESSGIVVANLRFFASLDFALDPNILVGVRAGFVLLRYPGTQAVTDGYAFGSPAYFEARVTGLIAKDALLHDGFAPVAFAGAGLSSFDGHTSGTATLCPTGSTAASCAAMTPTVVNVDMWRTNGPGFIDFGGGVRYAPAPTYALIAALRVNLSVGNNGLIPTFGPEVSGQVGF